MFFTFYLYKKGLLSDSHYNILDNKTSDYIKIVRDGNRNTTPRKWRWLQELKQQRENDIRTEMR
jgi:hypothetical protein